MSSQKQQPAKVSKLDRLRERQQRAEQGRRRRSVVEKQHAAGKMTAAPSASIPAGRRHVPGNSIAGRASLADFGMEEKRSIG